MSFGNENFRPDLVCFGYELLFHNSPFWFEPQDCPQPSRMRPHPLPYHMTTATRKPIPFPPQHYISPPLSLIFLPIFAIREEPLDDMGQWSQQNNPVCFFIQKYLYSYGSNGHYLVITRSTFLVFHQVRGEGNHVDTIFGRCIYGVRG